MTALTTLNNLLRELCLLPWLAVKRGPSTFLLTGILLRDGGLNGGGCSQYLHLLEAGNCGRKTS